MRILHTSDWHLGHRLHEQSQQKEQESFLAWLLEYIDNDNIDILLVAGDIFDTGTPSTQSQKMYYDFLVKLIATNCKQIVITGGNHDAPGTINAPKQLLDALSIKVVGKTTENIEDEIFSFDIEDESVIIAAVSYLRDQDIRRALAGESFDQISERYKHALTNHYNEIGKHCEEINKNNSAVIAMGHLFAVGGSTSESEQTIYVGGLGDISANDFPETFDYIALGHLHRPQIVGKKEHIRYSGSPTILSFSEINYDKKVVVLETTNNKITKIEDVTVPRFREFFKIEGNISYCINKLNDISEKNISPTPWIEVVLNDQNGAISGATEINRATEGLNLEVLKVTLKEDKKYDDLISKANKYTSVKELNPLEVFERKCAESEFNLEENQDILDAFNEILQIASNN